MLTTYTSYNCVDDVDDRGHIVIRCLVALIDVHHIYVYTCVEMI